MAESDRTIKPHGNTKHGFAKRGKKTDSYKTWESMIRRCTMPSQDSYPEYGGRGIRVCERWHQFENFMEDMGERPKGMTLDRFPDVNGNYEPSNCRWADWKTQQRNRRSNRLLTHQGITMTVVEWSEKTGIGSPTIRSRIDRYGWTVEKALTVPHRTRSEFMTALNQKTFA